MCECGADGLARMPMASVLEGCGDLGAGTPTQYVARWTEVAVVARERGYLERDSVVSFDDAAAVDAARPGIEDAVSAAIASEEDCAEERAREKTAALVSRLDRRRRPAGDGGQGKRRSVACPTPLREVLDGSIEHEERWNRCAELVADRGLSMKAAVLLFATTMFCFTKDLVCTMTRAQLMAMTGIRTSGSFAAAVRELMEQSLLSPQDGAPRTSWYLGEGFWGGLLADEDLETPVATLARRRKGATADGGKGSVRGGRQSAKAGRKQTAGAVGASADTGAENRTSGANAPGGRPGAPSTGIENRTSEAGPEGRRRAVPGAGAADESAAGVENRTSGLRNGKTKVTVAAFAAEELPQSPAGTMIAERLAEYYEKRGEYRIARARLRGLAARIRQDIEVDAVRGTVKKELEPRDRGPVARVGSRSRCRWCSSPFDDPAARGDRGDGVCRGCDARRSRDGPVAVGAVADEVGRRLKRGAAR